jgi:hypothetical protein
MAVMLRILITSTQNASTPPAPPPGLASGHQNQTETETRQPERRTRQVVFNFEDIICFVRFVPFRFWVMPTKYVRLPKRRAKSSFPPFKTNLRRYAKIISANYLTIDDFSKNALLYVTPNVNGAFGTASIQLKKRAESG